MPETTQHKAITLIREFFGAGLQDIKALTSLERQQLASGIARAQHIQPENCEFEHVAY